MAAHLQGLYTQLGPLLRGQVDLTSAQLLNLVGNPVTVVPAPGPGLTAFPVFIYQGFRFVAPAYGNVAGMVWGATVGFSTTFSLRKNFSAGGSQSSLDIMGSAGIIGAVSDNQPILLTNTGTNLTLGNGLLTVVCWYLLCPSGGI